MCLIQEKFQDCLLWMPFFQVWAPHSASPREAHYSSQHSEPSSPTRRRAIGGDRVIKLIVSWSNVAFNKMNIWTDLHENLRTKLIFFNTICDFTRQLGHPPCNVQTWCPLLFYLCKRVMPFYFHAIKSSQRNFQIQKRQLLWCWFLCSVGQTCLILQ